MLQSQDGKVVGRSLGLWLLIVLLVLVGLNAVGGGAVLIAAPDGSLMGIPAAWLQGSPFPDYLIPGLVLLVVLGIAPLAIAVGLARRVRWAWPAALLIGPALLIWITVQIVIIGYFGDETPLQPIVGSFGVAILVVSLLPGVRRAAGW